MSRNKLYGLLLTACATGYIWITVSFFRDAAVDHNPGVCLFKQFTNIPCPSCGSTRSIISLLHGDFLGSLQLNPLGVILMLILVISPLWILYDVVNQKTTLIRSYHYTEHLLKHKLVALPAILLVLLNWIWNICKGV